MFRPGVVSETQNNSIAGVEFFIAGEGFALKDNLFVSNSEWEVINVTLKNSAIVSKLNKNYTLSYPCFKVNIDLKRRPKFYVVSLILPLLSVVFVPTIGFLLPIESGEKVSLQVTAFLSYMVLLLVVIEVIPATADNFPVIGKFSKFLHNKISKVNLDNLPNWENTEYNTSLTVCYKCGKIHRSVFKYAVPYIPLSSLVLQPV